jgi:putative selenium metabolism hydrolase
MLKMVAEIKDEVVKFTQDIIKVQSYTGEEGELADFVLRKLQEFEVDEAFIDGIGNVVGIIRGDVKGTNVMLNGHLDIVPAGNIEDWGGIDPFGGQIDENGNIRGRGAADLKGGLSVQLYTMKLLKKLKDQGLSLRGNLIFSAVVHEEAAEMFGMEYLFKKTLPEKNLNVDIVFLCEPTGLDIVLGQRGKVELVVKTRGRAAHSSIPEAGINALEKMVPVLDHIFKKMSKKKSSHKLLGDSSISVTNLICRPGALSIIPDECEISIDRRYMPDQSIDDLLKEFESLFAELKLKDEDFMASVCARKLIERSYTGYEKEVKKYHPPWITDEDNALVLKTIQALKQVGQSPQIRYWKFGTDGSLTAGLMDIPTIGYAGTEECYAHTPEERVNIDMMIQSLEGYYAIAADLLGLRLETAEDPTTRIFEHAAG